MCVPPQCQHDIGKTGVWSLLLAWWRMKRVTCFAVWRMELYDSMLDVRLGYASICKRVAGHTHWILSRVSSALRCSGLMPSAEFVFAFLGATQLLWSVAVSPPPLCVWSLFGFCASVCRGFVSWLCVGGSLVLVVVGVFVRGSRTRPEPWTGLHCSEFHWRWPVELPALLSRAPASSKACTHGSFSTDPAALRIWYFVMSTQHLCTLLRLFTDNLAHTALLQIALGRWHPDRFEQLCLAPGDEPYAFEDTAL